jgi:hypothetical protein
MTTAPWDFEYLPLRPRAPAPDEETDFVVALESSADVSELSRALAGLGAVVSPLLDRAPLHWYRVTLPEATRGDAIGTAIEAVYRTRYVTSSHHSSLALAPPLDLARFPVEDRTGWSIREARLHPTPLGVGHWFLGRLGADVDRTVCGTGAGARLAVIDDEAREGDALDLDREIPIGVEQIPRGSSHGATMVAWASGTKGRPDRGLPAFAGVAPDASTRLYVMPKPGRELFWLPLALARAVLDGADVVVCATYVEGTTSPLLDDALELAARAGRAGKGTIVVLPTGREVSSAPGSVHASLTLGFGDPASDPRVLCVAPSGRDGGWFFWPDKLGKQRPFANRGPAVRVAAPGDDMAYPFATDGRLGHAESSGASAVAAGVATLLVARAPSLTAEEAIALLGRTAIAALDPPRAPLADPADAAPRGRDTDGHDAKTGYGRVSARRACLAALDPVSSALLAMGEDLAATRYFRLRAEDPALGSVYTAALGEWAARRLVSAPSAQHALCSLLRHVRLLAGRPERVGLQRAGAIYRAVSLLLREATTLGPTAPVGAELSRLERETTVVARAARDGNAENVLELRLLGFATRLFDLTARPRRSSAPPPSVGALRRSA